MTLKEKTIEDYLIEQTIKRGGFSRKYKSPGRRGVPDRIVFLPKGLVVFVECKKPNGKMSTSQKQEFKRMQELDTPCAYVKTMIDIDHLMQILDKLIERS